ncbi:hypothetical protein [Streptomyces sp. NPDC047043]|uniref:NACHT domain-containing protein n=1 Tax=Streptomyces sp. NPDC047043 TaxID=3154497 RepID=UPI0033D6704B
MAVPTAGPVADFCAELHRLVRVCELQQATIARALGRSESSVSDLLNGRRKKAPDWRDIRHIVALCAERGAKGIRSPENVQLDVGYWRGRHEALERAVERAATAPTHGPSAPLPSSAAPVPASTPTLDPAAFLDMGPDEAVSLLADGHPELMRSPEQLLTPLYEEQRLPYVLDALLATLPERVRAVRGVARGALLRAAHVVLAAALAQCVLPRPPLSLALADVEFLTSEALQPGRPPQGLLQLDADDHVQQARFDHCVEMLSQLARKCPEFALATALPGTRAHDTADGRDGTGLAGLEELLAECAGLEEPFTSVRSPLREPIASLESPGPRMPTLAQGYVNPRFRLADRRQGGQHDHGVASDKWWDCQPSYDTIEHFFAGYALGLSALLSPLVVLGDPGAGKSLLTKLLTARLPASEFRPLRVQLRHTPAEADLQTQLEHALKRATGRVVTWPDWSEADPGVVPVVLLDGFDELLQAGAQRLDSGRQWGYLREIELFQAREAGLGRPLIVIVTSRTVVADRAEIPYNSRVLRLERFEEPEIERWLATWNTTNADHFDRHGLRPLTLHTVLPHLDLAAHPLLLLMLALYDATGNALHGLSDDGFSRTQLYDRLLGEFVRRQVEKDGPLPPAESGIAVERELHRLSVIALGMFQRGAQAISEQEADRDLTALGAEAASGTGLLFGRFFFIHEAQAVVTEERLRSYEFMHATFGEHLAARLIDGTLHRSAAQAPLDDSELYVLLSFTPLTDRAQFVQNLRDRLAAWPARSRADLAGRLTGLFRQVAWAERRMDEGYVPVRQTHSYRDSVYEANLLLITVLAAGQVYASQLVGSAGDLVGSWRRHAMTWQAQLSSQSWDQLCSTLCLARLLHPEQSETGLVGPDLLISTTWTPLGHHQLGWTQRLFSHEGPDPLPGHVVDRLIGTGAEELIRRVMFAGDRDSEVLLHTSYPLLLQLPTAVSPIHAAPWSAAGALTALLTRDVHDPSNRHRLYVRCLGLTQEVLPDEKGPYLETVLRQLTHDAPSMPDDDLASVLSTLANALRKDLPRPTAATKQLMLHCAGDALDRGSPRLIDAVTSLQPFLFEYDDASTGADSALRRLSDLTRLGRSTHNWQWAGSLHGPSAAHTFDSLLAELDLPQVAATCPSVLLGLLRLAAELDLGDWLAAHTAEILAALPADSFGLLRPSDLPGLRAGLPEGAFEAEFQEVERTWRGRPTPPAETPAPRSPAG